MADDEVYFDPYSDIQAATNALQAIDGLDVWDKEERAMVSEVRQMSLTIIYNAICLIYSLHETEADQGDTPEAGAGEGDGSGVGGLSHN